MCAMARPARSLGLTLGTLLLASTALSACGGSSDDGGNAGNGPTTGATSTTVTGSEAADAGYPPVPSGVSLTAPGKALQLGQSATVAWKPNQQTVGVLDLTVTALHDTTFKQSFKGWQLDAATKANSPYFVTATVRNAGSTDLSGQQVPLYGSAASGALVEASSFATDFKPCHPGVLPTPFPAGATASVCLVYLVPGASGGAKGTLDGVSFRPSESFDPITWTGDVTPLATKKGKGAASASTSPTAGATGTAGGGAPTSSPSASLGVHMSGSPVR